MDQEEQGIEQLVDIVRFGCKFAVDLAESFADDGKLTFSDLPNFMDSLQGLPAAMVGITELPQEISDLSINELKEIKAVVIEELGESINEDYIHIAQNALDAAIALYNIYKIARA